MKAHARLWLTAMALLLAAIVLACPPSAMAETTPVRVAILVYNGVYDTEFMAPLDVLQHAADRSGGRLDVFLVAPNYGAVITAEGLRILPDYSLVATPPIDWLIVPSGENYKTDMKNAELIGWIRETGKQAQGVESNCWGAFLLGAAGLLDGKRATTFPDSLDELASAFPKARVQRDQQLMDDGNVITSAGGVVSYDAALYLVEKLLGAKIAGEVADGLLIDWNTRRRRYASAGAGGHR